MAWTADCQSPGLCLHGVPCPGVGWGRGGRGSHLEASFSPADWVSKHRGQGGEGGLGTASTWT